MRTTHDNVGSEGLSLAAYDLNLLVAFDALMRERQVSRAAARIGLSQSAMSHVLRRLRDTFGDELFLRTREGMMPSVRAMELSGLIGPALANLRMAMNGPKGFDPATSSRHFVIGMPDIACYAILPLLMRRLRETAPGISVVVIDMSDALAVEAVVAGRVELAFGVYGEIPAQIATQVLATVEQVCLADQNNPNLRDGRMTREAFLQSSHIRVTFNNHPASADVDRLFGFLGVERKIACEVPHYLVVPELVRGTDLIGIFEDRILDLLVDRRDFAVFEIPIALPGTAVVMLWHRRSQFDPGHLWLRDTVGQVIEGSLLVQPDVTLQNAVPTKRDKQHGSVRRDRRGARPIIA